MTRSQRVHTRHTVINKATSLRIKVMGLLLPLPRTTMVVLHHRLHRVVTLLRAIPPTQDTPLPTRHRRTPRTVLHPEDPLRKATRDTPLVHRVRRAQEVMVVRPLQDRAIPRNRPPSMRLRRSRPPGTFRVRWPPVIGVHRRTSCAKR